MTLTLLRLFQITLYEKAIEIPSFIENFPGVMIEHKSIYFYNEIIKIKELDLENHKGVLLFTNDGKRLKFGNKRSISIEYIPNYDKFYTILMKISLKMTELSHAATPLVVSWRKSYSWDCEWKAIEFILFLCGNSVISYQETDIDAEQCLL